MNSVNASGSLAHDKNADAPTISSTSGIRFSSLTSMNPIVGEQAWSLTPLSLAKWHYIYKDITNIIK